MRSLRTVRVLRVAGTLALAAVLSGCVLAPGSLEDEQERLAAAGPPFEPSFEARLLPELPPEPGWRDILQRAFLANGELEAAYFEWKAALERVGIAGAYPNTNVALSYQYLFSGGAMKAWDRSTFNVGFDPMQNLSFPTKVFAAGRVALDDARAAARRFAAAKFALQQRVLTAYLDYALLAEKLRLQGEQAALQRVAAEAAVARVQSGASQRDLLNAQVEVHLAESDLHNLEADVPQVQAKLNALMGRAPDDPLAPPRALPEARGLHADAAELLRLAAERNPDVAVLAEQATSRADAVEFAQQQYIPDVNPFAGFTGSIEQFAGAMLILPTTLPKIYRAVQEARANLRQADAMLRQARLDRGASVVAALAALRNSERQAAVLQEQILPAATLVVGNARQQYTSGAAELGALLETERTVLEARLALAEARTMREQRLAEIEALVGVDVETLEGDPAVIASAPIVLSQQEVAP